MGTEPRINANEEKLVLDKKALLKWVVAALIAVAAIIWLVNYNSAENAAERQAERDLRNAPTYAEIECKNQVEARLKAPRTAKFNDLYVVQDASGDYEVAGSVDSENSFGALVRSNFSCTIAVSGALTSARNVTVI